MAFLPWILSHKLLLVFVAATVGFGISTIVLGVDNHNLRSESSDSNTDTTNMVKYRLPKTAKPILYDLYLKPDLDTGLFSGEVTIQVDVFDAPKEIVLHSNQLSINKVTVNDRQAKWELDPTYELLKISNDNGSLFTEEQVNVYIEFGGDMKNRIVGLYTSSYTAEDDSKKKIATSKFEPTYARQAFPCFDEPNLKAKYKVRLFKPSDSSYIALSNNPEETPVDVDGGQVVSFKQTVPMSTYLVCFIVSDFISTDAVIVSPLNDRQIPFRVFATPAQLSKTVYAADVGKKVIEHYIGYFNIDYPLPKLDMVAIPDFVSGAMEHWGLVTYRETALLYTSATHSSANKQRVATVIAHELAHSWFGNLVTMNWWNDLWLNEGFASYIEYKGVEAAEPTWGMMDQFLVDDLHTVLALDATLGSHPIIVTVETPDEITSVFDTISYNKGAALLRMLENTVGEANFQKGVTRYLQNHIYSNAITQDLLDELDQDSDMDVTEFMATYTKQMGYPILNVAVDGDKYTFTQTRFLKNSALIDSTVTAYNYKWTVPITYVTDLGKSDGNTLFKYNASDVTITKPDGAKWIKFNYDQIGYYRVNYPEQQWMDLIEVYTTLDVSDRTHLIEESFAIAAAGQLAYSIPLDLSQKLTEEIDYVPWSAASGALVTIRDYLSSSTESNTKLKAYVQKVVTNAYNKLTWTEADDDGHLTKLARVVVLGLACGVDHADCLKVAKEKFDAWIEDPTQSLSQDLRGLIYRYGMKSATEEIWDKMFEVFNKESDANEKLKLLYGLTSVNSEDLLKKLLTLAEDETYIRSQDYFTLISYICVNPLGPQISWDYMRDNWTKLVDRFSLNNRNFGRMVITVTQKFATEEKVKEIQDFYTKYPDSGAGASPRVQALETVQNNIKWLSDYKGTVEDWLNTVSTK